MVSIMSIFEFSLVNLHSGFQFRDFICQFVRCQCQFSISMDHSISIFKFTWIQPFLLRRYQEQYDLRLLHRIILIERWKTSTSFIHHLLQHPGFRCLFVRFGTRSEGVCVSWEEHTVSGANSWLAPPQCGNNRFTSTSRSKIQEGTYSRSNEEEIFPC